MRLFFLLFCLLFSGCSPDKGFTEQNKFTGSLKNLFKVLGLHHDGSLVQMNELAQKELLRKPNQERWEMAKSPYENKKEHILRILDDLGLIQEIKPSSQSYDYILIQGALVKRMRERLHYLEKIWPSLDSETQKKVKIVFLTGGRVLDATQENTGVFLKEELSTVPFRPGWRAPEKLPKIEKEAAEFLWDQVIDNKDLRQKKDQGEVLFVNAPQIGEPPRRPTAADTINYWADSWRSPNSYAQEYQRFWTSVPVPPNKARYLVISNNPFILYQQKVTQNSLQKKGLLTKDSTIEVIGPAADPALPIAVHLDNIARILYEEITSIKM